MSDNNADDKTIRTGGRGKLSLSRSNEPSTVRQNFSHGRSKVVVVETKKRKFTAPGDKVIEPVAPEPVAAPTPPPVTPAAKAPEPAAPVPVPTPVPAAPVEVTAAPEAPAAPAEPVVAKEAPAPVAAPVLPKPRETARPQSATDVRNSRNAPAAAPISGRKLSNSEMDARRRALEAAKIREVEDAKQAKIDAERRKREEAERIAAAEVEAQRAEEEGKRRTEPAKARKTADDNDSGDNARNTKRTDAPSKAGGARKPERTAAEAPAKPSRTRDDDRRRGKLTLTAATSGDEGRSRSLSAMRRRQEKMKRAQGQQTPREKVSREVQLPETITIQELAQRMTERSVDVIKMLMAQGQMMKPGDVIDADMAELITSEFGHTVKRVTDADVETGLYEFTDAEETLVSRPPVVTIMGHVDHGKTSLLDAIREASVVSGEAGGITQHIGAYQVIKNGQTITFIDTPGHAAFTAMRARGAQATDIAILVVAADDSVMPQTIESINHAKAADVPIIVAINKIDKPQANAQKVRTELLQHEVFVESLGGEVLDVEVSATKGTNLDKLLDTILLQAELLDLKANPNREANGVVIEAQLDKGRGPVATVLVKGGTLNAGDIVVAGNEWGKVRALLDDQGNQIKTAGPSLPVEILGLSGTPEAGDLFAVVNNEAKAREITDYRQRLARDKSVAHQAGQRGSLEQMMTNLSSSGLKEFPLLIKGDVQGSVEAIMVALDKIGTEEVRARIIHSGAGGITESDIALAEASDAAIIGFNVRANKHARDAAEAAGIEIRYYNIIYNLLDDMKLAMAGLLSPERRETFLGNAEILEVFNVSKIGKVAGCRVVEGKVERGAGVRLVRDNVVIHEGTLKTLKRFKDEVAEVPNGQECGMAFMNYEDMRAGDVIECFRVEEIARTL